MFTLQHKILIGSKQEYLLRRIVSVQVQKDIHTLGDRARITLIALNKNRSLGTDTKIKVGTPIEIALGYDQTLATELHGFIEQIESKEERLILHCMDHMYLFLKDVTEKTYEKQAEKGYPLETILQDLAQTIGSPIEIKVGEALSAFQYKSFQRTQGPAINTLKKIKEDLGILIYMRGSTLHVQAPHQSDSSTEGKEISYSLEKNILKSSLIYRRASDKDLRIRVKSRDEKDNPIEVIASGDPNKPDISVKEGGPSAGGATSPSQPSPANTTGSESIELLRYHIPETQELEAIARQELSRWKYDGYEGHIETWLQPYCSYGYYATLKDDPESNRSGTFFVEKVEVHFSEQGGRRKVYLSKRRLGPATKPQPSSS